MNPKLTLRGYQQYKKLKPLMLHNAINGGDPFSVEGRWSYDWLREFDGEYIGLSNASLEYLFDMDNTIDNRPVWHARLMRMAEIVKGAGYEP